MRYKTMKSAGIQVSEMSVGTWAIGARNYGATDRNKAIEAIRAMLDNGVNLIDTAPCYGNGASEIVVGEAIEGLNRDKLLIMTKFGLSTNINMPTYTKDASYSNIMREIESSLVNLNTDYIDFYLLHYPDMNTHISETMNALRYLKEKGYVHYVGVSNLTREQLEQAMQYGKIDVFQMSYAMVNRNNEQLLQWAYANEIDIVSYGSLGSGILTGGIRSLPDYGAKDVRNTFYDYFREPKFSRIMKLLERMDVIALAHNKPVAQVAINWSTQKEFMATILVGVRDAVEAVENCAAFDWKLSDEEIDSLDKALDDLQL